MSWLHTLWFGYFWPSDQGNGPEALQQTVLYALIAVVLIPPIRHAVERFAKRHAESIKAHVEAENAHLHAKLDHVIRHSPHIPNDVPGVPAEHQPKSLPDTPSST